MSKQKRKPLWLIPIALLFAVLGVLVLLGRDGLPGWANETVGIAVVLFLFAGMAVWFHLSMPAFLDEELEQSKHEEITVAEYLPGQPFSRPMSRDRDSVPAGGDLPQVNPFGNSRN